MRNKFTSIVKAAVMLLQFVGSRQHMWFETFVENLAPYLVERGWEVFVFCQELGSGEPWEIRTKALT